VQHLGANLEKIQEILQAYQNFNFGELTISKFDLTYFTDMNSFIPLTTFHLNEKTQ
jgi:hypothetical protein